MICTIARKHIKEFVRSGRLVAATVTVLGLMLAALALSWVDQSRVSLEREIASTDSRKAWESQGERNPHSASHFGEYAFKPVTPLSIIEPGLSDVLGAGIWVEGHYQNPSTFRDIDDSVGLHRFGSLTPALVLQLFVPFLIILITFDSFSRERVQGTLRPVLSTGVTPSKLLLGKAAGSAVILSAIMIPPGLLSLGLIVSFADAVSLLETVAGFSILFLVYAGYFTIFACVSFIVSAIARDSRMSLVVLLIFWLGSCILVPRFANDFATNVAAVPDSSSFWKAVREDMRNGVDGHNPADERSKELERRILAQYNVASKEELPINLSGIALQAGEEHGNLVFDKHYGKLDEIHRLQDLIRGAFGALSPFIPMQNLSMGISGTDLHQQKLFARQVEMYRREMQKLLNLNLAYNSTTKDGSNYRVSSDFWETTPRFTFAESGLSTRVVNQTMSLGLLSMWLLLSLFVTFKVVNRLRI